MIPAHFAGTYYDADPTWLIHVQPMVIGNHKHLAQGFKGLAIRKELATRKPNGQWDYNANDIQVTETHFINPERARNCTLAKARSLPCSQAPSQQTNNPDSLPTPSS